MLVPAHCLVGGTGITQDATAVQGIEYWHFARDDHAIVTASGLRSESFHPGAYGLSTLDRAARQELLRILPEINIGTGAQGPQICRRCLKQKEAWLLIHTMRAARRQPSACPPSRLRT